MPSPKSQLEPLTGPAVVAMKFTPKPTTTLVYEALAPTLNNPVTEALGISSHPMEGGLSQPSPSTSNSSPFPVSNFRFPHSKDSIASG